MNSTSSFDSVCSCSRRYWAVWLITALLPYGLSLSLADQEGDFEFQIVGDGVEITRYLGPGGEAVIPDHLASNPVVAIGAGAFSQDTNLTSVVLPDTLTSIGPAAFSDCTALRRVNIPEGVTSIEDRTFSGCTQLREVALGLGLRRIGQRHFDDPCTIGCWSSGAFSRCYSLQRLTIPKGVEEIGWFAFYGCSSLTNVTIPGSVTMIDNSAFSECSALIEVAIPNGNLGANLFYRCTRLQTFIAANLEDVDQAIVPAGDGFGGLQAFEFAVEMNGLVARMMKHYFDGTKRAQ